MKKIIFTLAFVGLVMSCDKNTKPSAEVKTETTQNQDDFNWTVEQFSDIKVLRYQIPGWEELSIKQQTLVYYLTQAGLSGRDMMWDQNYRHNLKIRKALEKVVTEYTGDKSSEDWTNFMTYTKRVWFSNGIHHHYSNAKIQPEFNQEYFQSLLTAVNHTLSQEVLEAIFNPTIDAKKVNLDPKKGLVKGSAINFYSPNVTSEDVDNFYADKIAQQGKQPLELGLNSKLVKLEDGSLKEQVWKVGGMYSASLEKVVYWLEKAKTVAENDAQAHSFDLLIKYYQTGDLKTWDEYNIAWAKNATDIDYINGFIEVYNDPRGFRGSYETVVQITDFDMSKKMSVLSKNAQWFEDNSTIAKDHKKPNVVGVAYKTVNVAGEAGDASPSTPIGVNLPNNNWIREVHGSKSVSLANIIHAYSQAGGSGKLKEFAHDKEEIQLEEEFGGLADKLHTSLHEVIGHASGVINDGIGQPKETLKNYASTLEEGRADLVGLYYLMDPKLQEIGLVTDWEKTGKAAYDGYIRAGMMTQLVRLKLGDDVEEAHMRNRQWVSAWVFEKGQADKVIEKVTRDGKTYFNILDYPKLRVLFGELLKETQRIKSEGDFEAAKALVEGYGVKVDPSLHKEILDRNAQFKSAPYSGFVNPKLVPNMDSSGNITSIKVVQPDSFEQQMLEYAKEYSFLPEEN